MSSTNINVGIFDGRNSSRVLKPPGGGHSQIFGGQQEAEKPRPKMKHHNSTEINACFSHDIKPDKIEKIDVPKNAEINGDEKQENSENSKPDILNINEDVKQQQAPNRVRVPPGGFSSGFW